MGKYVLPNTHPSENLSKLSEQNQGFKNVAVACPNDSSCTYKFQITRDIESPDQYHRRTDCDFTVNRLLDHPTAQVNMTSQLCKGTFDEFKVSGHGYFRGFLTFCVVHEASDNWAYFGYQVQLIHKSIVPRMCFSGSFRIGTYNDTNLPPRDLVGSKAELWPDTEVG